jgi:hypothetical protein
MGLAVDAEARAIDPEDRPIHDVMGRLVAAGHRLIVLRRRRCSTLLTVRRHALLIDA